MGKEGAKDQSRDRDRSVGEQEEGAIEVKPLMGTEGRTTERNPYFQETFQGRRKLLITLCQESHNSWGEHSHVLSQVRMKSHVGPCATMDERLEGHAAENLNKNTIKPASSS